MEINNFTHYKFEGWLPNDWEVKDAADVCIKITDGTHDTPKVVDSGIPFITAIHVKKGKIDFDNCLYISEEEHEKIYKRCNPSKGDLLVVNIGAGVAEYAFVETDKEFSLKNVALLKPNSDLLHDKYLCYHHAYKKENIAHRVKSGGAQPFLSLKELRKLKIVLPPLPEQQKIAKILSTWDKVISTTECLIENSTQQKKALMQQLLTGKKRLLDDSGKHFEYKWQEFKLGSLFKERVETGFNDLPLVSITSSQGVIKRDDIGRKDTSSADKTKYKRICFNDIGYNTMRMWQGVSGRSEIEGIVSPAYTILTPTDKVCPKFAAYLFKLPSLVHVFERNSQGLVSDTWNLKYSNFKVIKYKFPSLEEQQKIAAVLTIADKEIELLKQKLADLQQEKKALMQVLLTGKKRVKLND